MGFQGCYTCFDGMKQALTGIIPALKRDPDNNTPRTPPPVATPLDFPQCEPRSKESGNRDAYDLVKLFSRMHKGPSSEHLDALNVDLQINIPLEELVPAGHLPPISWLQTPGPSVNSVVQPTLVNGGSLPAQEVFYTRAKELEISNDNGYRTVHRVPLANNESPIRLLFLRKFWEELDCVADYWDTSRDNYIKSEVRSRKGSDNAALDVDQLRKMAQDESKMAGHHQSDNMDTKMQDPPPNQYSTSSSRSRSGSGAPINDDQNTSDCNDTPMPDISSTSTNGVPPSQPTADSTLYTGHRTSNGSLMPPQHLERTLFALLDAVALPFRLRLNEPRSQLRLQLGPLFRLPLPHMASVHRIPLDSARARQGWREGPLLGAVSTEHAVWRESGQTVGDGAKERLQLLKEVGCVLLLAQRRAMEGKEEVVPGKGKWWAETPRWGGGSGVAVYKEPLPSPFSLPPIPPPSAAGASAAPDTTPCDSNESEGPTSSTKAEPSLIEAQRRRVKRARRQLQQERQEERQKTKANTLIPPRSLWERNVQYARIGMDRETDVDDIYVLSSVNHHVSVIHARVHTRYIEYLTHDAGFAASHKRRQKDEEEQEKVKGEQKEQEADWWQLRMQRSRWFDLLDPHDRVEAMRGMWAVMSWMMREG